jgi:hypothetical protein
VFARIFEYKFTNLNQAKIAANHLSMELGDKIEKFNINSLSITIGKCASISIVCKFENNSDMQKFEQFASSLLKQMKQTFTFKSSDSPGVTIFNYESEAAMEAIELN